MVSREGALKALYCLSMIDGMVSPEEVARFGEMANSLDAGELVESVIAACEAANVDFADDDESYDRIAETLDEALRSGGDVPDRMLVWDLLALAYSDGDRSSREMRLIKHVVRTRGIDNDIFLEMEGLMTSAIDVNHALEVVKNSTMPYIKAQARVEALEKRLDTIGSAALMLISDEIDPVPDPEPIVEHPVDPVAAAAEAVNDAGMNIAQAVGDAVSPVLSEAQKGLAGAGAAVADVGKQAMDGLADMGKQAADGLADAGSQVAGFIGNLFGGKK